MISPSSTYSSRLTHSLQTRFPPVTSLLVVAVKITGPWKAAILYVLGDGSAANAHYDTVLGAQFHDLAQHEGLPLAAFIEVLCENFVKYVRSLATNF